MNVRVIAGRFGGRVIAAPDTSRTHPMSERARNALFNSIGDEIIGASVLDTFAGSGAIGFEAISRGAAMVTFVERDRVASKVIRENIALLGVEHQTKLIATSVSNWMDTAEKQDFGLIFADPPYHDEQFSTILRLQSLLKPKGLMVLSHIGRSEVPIQGEIVVVDNRSYGTVHLTFFRRG